MGLFATIKKKLGIGGLKFTIDAPGQVSFDATSISGKINLNTKSDQDIVKIEYKVFEERTKGKGDDKETKTFTLGKIVDTTAFTLASGQQKTMEFEIPIEVVKSNNQELADMGGALGALGKFANKISNEKSAYFVEVSIDVKGVVLDPLEKHEFRFV